MGRARARAGTAPAIAAVLLLVGLASAAAQQSDAKIAKTDYQIDAVDPGIKLFIREKLPAGTTRFTDANVVLFLHGATIPSVPDFDLDYKDYSWADRLVREGYAVYLVDYRNYGFSTRERAMEEPAAQNKPVSRSYLAIRDIGAAVDHIRQKRGIDKVNLIGWSWGAMLGGYYASLHSEKVNKLVMYAPAYAFAQHTNLGAGTALQNKRKPLEFNYANGAYRLSSYKANKDRWDGEIPVENKDAYREPGVVDAFINAALETDPMSKERNPPALRAPNGVLEDTFMQATGRRIWNASSIYVPVLVIAGEYDTWSYPEDRETLMRDLTNAHSKKSVLIPDATHFVIFEKNRFRLYEEVSRFLKD
jgi:pimeloyl-ACP methyl ester carboxylesterase